MSSPAEGNPSDRPRLFRRPQGARPRVLGHRGARHAAPENTLAAFELAHREGADGVELDVRLDGSGGLVVIHDRDLARVTSEQRRDPVEKLSTRALQQIDVGKGERVPLLLDALAWARERDALVNVEVKSDVSERRRLLTAVATALRTAPGSERILVSSFNPWFVRVLSRSLPHLPVCWLIHQGQRAFAFARAFRALGAQGLALEHPLLSLSTVRKTQRDGGLLLTWTVNDPGLAAAYAELGVDSIISDRPGALLAALSRMRRD